METLANFITGTTYEDIPKEAEVSAKKAILDYLGVTVAGSRESTGKIIIDFVRESGGLPEAGVIAGGFKTSPFMAALANGTMGHALDFDDECESWNSHPTVAILPAVLALGEKLGTSGREILIAYILGWEVAARLGSTTFHRMIYGGWHPTSAVGTLSATAASARILRLSKEQAMVAFGIGSSQACGMAANIGTDTKPLHAGLAASNGVRAAQLASRGFTANPTILEDPHGYFKAMIGGGVNDLNMAGLGKSFDIAASLCIKTYPTNYTLQRPLDSILYLINKHSIRSEDVAEVEMTAHPFQIRFSPHKKPKSVHEAKFSMEYAMASALVYGRAGLDEYTEEKVFNPRIQEFLPKVKVVPIEGKTDDYAHCAPGMMVKVKLKDGREFSFDAGVPKGHCLNPMSLNDVIGKFRSCVGKTLSAEDTERVTDLIEKFESMKDVRELMSIMAGSKP